MAQYRQSGTDRVAVRSHHDQISIRVPHKHHPRIRRPGKPPRRLFAVAVAVTLSLALLVTLLSIRHLSRHQGFRSSSDEDDDQNESYEESLPTRNQSMYKELEFGQGSSSNGRDSRYWDRDDRRRDSDYREEDVSQRGNGRNDEHPENEKQHAVRGKRGVGGLYNEGGRAELDSYKEEFEESLKNEGQSDGVEEANGIDEYDDGIDAQDDHDEAEQDEGDQTDDGTRKLGVIEKNASVKARNTGAFGRSSNADGDAKMDGKSAKLPGSERKPGLKRKPKHHKISGSSCQMKFLNSAAQLIEPVENKKFSRFALQYTNLEDRPSGSEKWEPRFSGHQTLREREESFYARDQRINCGFIKGPKGSASTGFDLAEDDVKFMSSCHIAVSSCIFGNSDRLRSPFRKTITRQSRKNVCFIMFVDEITLETLSAEGQKMDTMGFIGLWKIVVVKNLPYTDMRRVGKIPKFLAHRLFPSARYSIWLDSKLRLQTDPYLILEYFLWRRGYEYSISNHYDRHCVWEEVMQNKKLNKFNHTIIDQQFDFYRSDGLKRFDPSDPNKLLPSYVPEGSFIMRAHTPMSNLFSCLWFNEVDRFTPRDQLSFAYTYLKLRRMNPGKPLYLNMFKDCERRSIAKLFHHRAEEKRTVATAVD